MESAIRGFAIDLGVKTKRKSSFQILHIIKIRMSKELKIKDCQEEVA